MVKKIKGIVATAGKPDALGTIFSKQALELLARSDSRMWMEGDSLLIETEVDDNDIPMLGKSDSSIGKE